MIHTYYIRSTNCHGEFSQPYSGVIKCNCCGLVENPGQILKTPCKQKDSVIQHRVMPFVCRVVINTQENTVTVLIVNYFNVIHGIRYGEIFNTETSVARNCRCI